MNRQRVFAILCVTSVVSATDPSGYQTVEVKKPIIPILKQTFDQHKEGYQYSYETGNGIQVEQTGYIKNRGDEKHETLVQQGSVTYHDEHGQPITLNYIADEHGFRAQGAHLPTPPPIPEEIQKAIVRHRGQEAEQLYHQQAEVPQEYVDVSLHGHEAYQ